MSSMKRKATVSRPSYSTPDIIRERPSADFARRDIIYERVFPTYELEKREECQWTMDFIQRNNYGGITLPFADMVYPRLVQLFYQGLQYGSTAEGELYIEFTIDGHHGKITTSDMGIITKLPAVYSETLSHLEPPLIFPNDESIIECILENFGIKGSGESIKLSSLPPRVWLLDKILKENVYPLGNYTERRIELLLAIYSAHEGYFYSIPYLLMLGIQKTSQEIKNKTSPGNTRPLPYGFLVTAILRYTEYFLDDDEPFLDIDARYPLSAWISCYTKLQTANGKRIEDTKRRSTPVGKFTATKDTIAPGVSGVSIADFDTRLSKIEEQQKEILYRQGELINQQFIINLLMRVIARRQIGDVFEQQLEEEGERKMRGDAAVDATNAYKEEDEETNSDTE